MQEVLDRKRDSESYVEDNLKKVYDSFERNLAEIKEIEYIIISNIGYYVINQNSYVSKQDSLDLHSRKNEFFDYTGNDEDILSIINKNNDKVLSKWYSKFSPYAVSTRNIFYHFEVVKFLSQRMSKHVIMMIADPAVYSPYFKHHNIPIKYCYFENDNRGTRNFEKFDLAQLQHLVYDLEFENPMENCIVEQNKNLLFIGTLFYMKGNRPSKYFQFLEGIKDENSEIYVPMRLNGVIKRGNGNTDLEDKVKEEFPEIYESLKSHNNYKGHIKPENVLSKIKEFKYSLILSCVSPEDSLNFRIVRDVYHNILPFLDQDYDPCYLQIPKHIQDKLIVTSGEDINDKIKYFNDNNQERMDILRELRQLFNIDAYLENPKMMVDNQIRKIIPEFE